MRIEVHEPVAPPEATVNTVGELTEFWSGPVQAQGAALRALLSHTYSQGLQSRWSYGGYRFVFLRERRDRPSDTPPPDELVARMLVTAFRSRPDPSFPENTPELEMEPLKSSGFHLPAASWGTVDEATSTWLDEWLLFRRSNGWVRQDDVPTSMEHILTRPWYRCIEDLVDSEQWTAAICHGAEGFTLRHQLDCWGDYGTALIVATTKDVYVIQVGLWTD